jgi:DNA-binding transcriptional MerR regulator
METTYSMSELVRLTGIEARTIRYYIAQGLLPGPLKRGRGAGYSEVHLDRLKLISLLKQSLKLEDIQAKLSAASPQEIRQLLSEWVEPPPKISAQDYLSSVQSEFGLESMSSRAAKMVRGLDNVQKKELPPKNLSLAKYILAQRSNKDLEVAEYMSGASQSESEDNERVSPINRLIRRLDPENPPVYESSYKRAKTWKVISITPSVELHLKDPDDLTLARMERASELIRNLLTGVDDD